MEAIMCVELPIRNVDVSRFGDKDIARINGKFYANFRRLVSATYCDINGGNKTNRYRVDIDGALLFWESDRNFEFENQFPLFPYIKPTEDGEKITAFSYFRMAQKIDKLEKEMSDLKEQNMKIISHLESLMVGLGARSYTDQPLEL